MKQTHIFIVVLAAVIIIGGVVFLSKKQTTATGQPQQIACTTDAKQCPDGSYVGRQGPQCEFAACPGANAAPSSVSSNNTSAPITLAHLYENKVNGVGYSIRYPDLYKLDTGYTYDSFGPNKSIKGVKFTIDPKFSYKTNLSADSYISVEQKPGTNVCSANLFLNDVSVLPHKQSEGSMTYSVATVNGAGAGNRYEETVYALPNSNPCIAVRYFIHYGVLENYEPGAVTAYDREGLLSQFDAIRHSLTLTI